MAAQSFNCDVGLPPNSYIYRIISTAARQDPLTYSSTDQLAIISSDDSLRFLDPVTLKVNSVVKTANNSITCLERANDAPSNIVATAGRDGLIRYWDQRSRQKVLEIQSRTFVVKRYDHLSRLKRAQRTSSSHPSSAMRKTASSLLVLRIQTMAHTNPLCTSGTLNTFPDEPTPIFDAMTGTSATPQHRYALSWSHTQTQSHLCSCIQYFPRYFSRLARMA